jgi:hypothetical protein
MQRAFPKSKLNCAPNPSIFKKEEEAKTALSFHHQSSHSKRRCLTDPGYDLQAGAARPDATSD